MEELGEFVKSLCFTSMFSDINITLKDRRIAAHKVVLHARSSHWSLKPLTEVSDLDWSHLNPEVGIALIKWIYTSELNDSNDSYAVLELLKVAVHFKLCRLVAECENHLIPHVSKINCVPIYIEALELCSSKLIEQASQVISMEWTSIDASIFQTADPSLVCDLVVKNDHYPLHFIVRLHRIEVVKMVLQDTTDITSLRMNDPDEEGYVPLEIALYGEQYDIADLLCGSNADLNAKDSKGWTLLQRAISVRNSAVSEFLINHGSDIFCVTPEFMDTCLHLICGRTPCGAQALLCEESDSLEKCMGSVAQLLLSKGLDPNKKNNKGFAPLHMAVIEFDKNLLSILLEHENTDINAKTEDGYPPLWYALKSADLVMAEHLLERGAKVDAIMTEKSSSLLQQLIDFGHEEEALFILDHLPKSHLNYQNNDGQTALYLASENGMKDLVRRLIELGADPNIVTVNENEIHHRNCLHAAIVKRHVSVVQLLVSLANSCIEPLRINEVDSVGFTPISLILDTADTKLLELIPTMLGAGANINQLSPSGETLLIRSINRCDKEAIKFLLHHGADVNFPSANGDYPIHLAIQRSQPSTIEELCKKGVNLSVRNSEGFCALWAALINNHRDMASILVKNGADTDAWELGPSGFYQTLLHNAIDSGFEEIAVFLIESGCDLNSPRRSSREGNIDDEVVCKHTPLHMACFLGQKKVVSSLLECGASINSKNSEGKIALHIAIEENHNDIIQLLLSHPSIDILSHDANRRTPFAVAVAKKNRVAARCILDRRPDAAEEYNLAGYNLLHKALMDNDLEVILFVLSLGLQANTKTRDGNERSPLHLAAAIENEVVIRTLILTSAVVNATDKYLMTPLHVAATHGHSTLIIALLQNGANSICRDVMGNTPLHYACKQGHLSAARVLAEYENSDGSNFSAFENFDGQNPMHFLAKYGKDNAATIFAEILKVCPLFPLNVPDNDGNTALLLAYSKGNGNLCRALVKSGASLVHVNKNGCSIFNIQVATNTKQLLYSLLECLEKEPPWAEGDVCQHCDAKFSLKVRRHHCRHCGRLLCARCSDHDTAIIKFKLNKPVRVCEMCYEVLQGFYLT